MSVRRVDGMAALLSEAEDDWLRRCAWLAPDGCFVELGPYQGASTVTIAQVANERGLPFVTIDTFSYRRRGPSGVGILIDNLQGAGIDPLPRIIKGMSHEVPDGVEDVALLFIDTDHRAQALNRELDAWLPLMAMEGVVALHDYGGQFPEMKPTIDKRLGADGAWVRLGLVGALIAFRRMA